MQYDEDPKKAFPMGIRQPGDASAIAWRDRERAIIQALDTGGSGPWLASAEAEHAARCEEASAVQARIAGELVGFRLLGP